MDSNRESLVLGATAIPTLRREPLCHGQSIFKIFAELRWFYIRVRSIRVSVQSLWIQVTHYVVYIAVGKKIKIIVRTSSVLRNK